MTAHGWCTESQKAFLGFGKRVGSVAAKPGERDLPIRKLRVIQKMLKLIVWNCLDLRIDEGADFMEFGEQVCQLCTASKIVIVRTVFGVFERGVVAQSFGHLPEPALELQTRKECVSRFREMSFELCD